MNRLSVLLLSCGVLLSACSWLPSTSRDDDAAAGTPLARVDGVEIERVQFRPGVSSATVEKLAKRQGCAGGWGAGLVSEPGPVEIYRMTCESGKVFMAKCELKQCKAM
jgi:hypothetical protein